MGVILVGSGKAGILHATCYSKIRDLVKVVAVVDKKPEQLKSFQKSCNDLFKNEVIYANSLKDASKEVDLLNSIGDICVPNDAHYSCVKEVCELGVRSIIIEKPIAHTLMDARRIEEVDALIGVIQNYVYSPVTLLIKTIIDENGFKPKFARTEFSKDRRVSSEKMRGFLKTGAPHVFTVEMPHQLSLVNYLFSSPTEIYEAWCADMLVGSKTLHEHGDGAIVLAHKENGVISYNYSSLNGYRHLPMRYRGIKIHCQDNIKINGHYPAGGDDALFGLVEVYDNDHIIERYDVKDDCLTKTLATIVKSLNKNKRPITDAKFGREIVEVIENSIRLARVY